MVAEWKGVRFNLSPEEVAHTEMRWNLLGDLASARLEIKRMLEGDSTLDRDPIEKAREIIEKALEIGIGSIKQFHKDAQVRNELRNEV